MCRGRPDSLASGKSHMRTIQEHEPTFKPCLQMSDVWTTSMLAINYHSDGKTYAGLPGDFGYNAHVPLFLMLPQRDGIQ